MPAGAEHETDEACQGVSPEGDAFTAGVHTSYSACRVGLMQGGAEWAQGRQSWLA
jgi:hypothetical protein